MTFQLRISRAQNDEMRLGWGFPIEEDHNAQATLQLSLSRLNHR